MSQVSTAASRLKIMATVIPKAAPYEDFEIMLNIGLLLFAKLRPVTV
jgi:hypothetical protein